MTNDEANRGKADGSGASQGHHKKKSLLTKMRRGLSKLKISAKTLSDEKNQPDTTGNKAE